MEGSTGRSRFRIAVLAIGVAAVSLTIAACGGGDSLSTGSDEATTATAGEPTGKLTISNWPLYIDKKTISDFQKETGIKVEYIEDVNDNDEFFGKVQPLFSQGDAGGRSIVVTSDWMSGKSPQTRLCPEHGQSGVAGRRRVHDRQPEEPDLRPEP